LTTERLDFSRKRAGLLGERGIEGANDFGERRLSDRGMICLGMSGGHTRAKNYGAGQERKDAPSPRWGEVELAAAACDL